MVMRIIQKNLTSVSIVRDNDKRWLMVDENRGTGEGTEAQSPVTSYTNRACEVLHAGKACLECTLSMPEYGEEAGK